MLRLNLPNETLSNLRFAYSPLVELTVSYRMLRGQREHTGYQQWLEEAKQATSDRQFPYMDALIRPENGSEQSPNGYIPDFLTPTPAQPILDIESEFARIQAFPMDVIRDGIQQLIFATEPTDLLCDFLAHPYEGMRALIGELRDYWQRTLAHHWNRMVAVLENDILYHSRILTLNGIEGLMPALNKFIGYEPGTITIGWCKPVCDTPRHKQMQDKGLDKPDMVVQLDSDTFHLVPVIFSGEGVYHQIQAPWQPMILYHSRGAGLWNYESPEPMEALELVMGAGKSRILVALESPFSTGELARKLSLTSGAVSQQLGKLHRAGLVESHRSGKHVFYRLSQRGTQLVSLFG